MQDNNHKKTGPYEPRYWQLAHDKELCLGKYSKIMGILNVTPDSFSDGGKFQEINKAIDHAAKLINDGADIIDVGGESTRPGAQPLNEEAERERVLPVIASLSERFNIIISVDTYRSKTAGLAIEAGAHIVNDVHAFQFDKKMALTVSKYRAGACLMHNSRGRKVADDLIDDQIQYLGQSILLAKQNNISEYQIVLDPGFGFGKNNSQNLGLLSRLDELVKLGFPLLAGTSRKRFITAMMGNVYTIENKDIATASSNVIARMAGCAIFRVHDVKTSKFALKIADGVINSDVNSK